MSEVCIGLIEPATNFNIWFGKLYYQEDEIGMLPPSFTLYGLGALNFFYSNESVRLPTIIIFVPTLILILAKIMTQHALIQTILLNILYTTHWHCLCECQVLEQFDLVKRSIICLLQLPHIPPLYMIKPAGTVHFMNGE